MGCPVLSIAEAAQKLHDGDVIAYPTEAVFGLGCDPLNHEAVVRLLELKGRPESAGLILIADEFSRFGDFVALDDPAPLERALKSWPGPVTWLFPRSVAVPGWISGNHDSVALRVTDHPVCRQLCSAYGGAIVSTSANRSGEEPAGNAAEVERSFGLGIAGIVEGALGGLERPSEIRDARTGEVMRPG